MGDLISRSRLKEELKSWAIVINKPKFYSVEDADFVIDTQAAVDEVEVDEVEIVRCKDCGKQPVCRFGMYLGDYGFCSNGVREEK